MHNKNTRVILFALICSMLIGGFLLFLISPRFIGANMASIEDIFYQNSKRPKISALNDSIFIDGNDMFAAKVISEDWSGDGSLNDPYIIENYTIRAISEHGIEIRNTTLHFIIRNVSITNGRSNYYHGFYLYNVTNGILKNNTADNNLAGFLLVNSDNNTFSNNVAINNLHGFRFWHSNNNTLANSTANSNLEYGIYLDNSNYNNITLNTVLFNELGCIYEENCVGNDISDNICYTTSFTLYSDADDFDTDGSFTLTWTASENADNYTLYQDGVIIAEGLKIREYNLTDLPSGTYLFYVKAINEERETDSNTIEVIVKFILCSDADNFDPDGSFTLTWMASKNADNYTLYQDGVIIAEGLKIREYNLNDLPSGTYLFYVKAINEEGETDSNAIEVIVKFIRYVDGNVDFHQTAIAKKFAGNGTYDNPYIIENHEIVASEEHGIHIQNTNVYFIIRNVTVSNGRSNYKYGFYLRNVTNGKLENNTANNNVYGFFLKDSYNNTLTGNEVTNNTYYGFFLDSSNNNILTKNIATGNLNGFTLTSSNYNTLTNNTANNNDQHGFRLLFSHYNKLIENSASYNQKYGIYLEESTFNVITGNILENNGIGAIYEKFTDDTDYPDVFLIAAIIFIIALLSIILIKLVFFIKRKNIKFFIPKLTLKKRKE